MIISKDQLRRTFEEAQREMKIDRDIAHREEVEQEHRKQRVAREIGEHLFRK